MDKNIDEVFAAWAADLSLRWVADHSEKPH